MHRSIQSLGGSLTALVTPFRDTQLDLPALARLAARQRSAAIRSASRTSITDTA